MIKKGKGRREMPFFCKIVFTNHRFSKQMLKNQVLKIFFLENIWWFGKKDLPLHHQTIKNNSNNKKFKHYGKRKFLP